MNRPDTFVSVDIETTGLDPGLHEIIEIGAVRVKAGEFAAEYSELVKPQKPLPEFITGLTGITGDDLRNAGSIREVMPSFVEFAAGYPVVGQNIGFDLSFLRAAGGAMSLGDAIDTCEFSRVLVPTLSSYSLDSLVEFFAVSHETRHRALADAKATAEVYLRLVGMLRMMPDDLLSEMTALALKTGSTLGEVFTAHLRERADEPLHRGIRRHAPVGVPLQPDNLLGDFSVELPDTPDSSARVAEEAVESILREGGALSECQEGFEERTGQIMLAKGIARAFNESEVILAEAGTGTGKSIAYLMPSIMFASAAGERVIVSTNTKNLQEQLFFKDIPILAKVLDPGFRAVILKGRGNYICLSRWRRLVDFPEQYLSRQEKALVLPVAAWLRTTTTGDLSETGFFPMLAETGLLERINSEPISCLGPRCTHRERCFVNRVRKAAQRAHIIVVNHSLVFSDMVSEGSVLGDYSRIVFDEAHNLERAAMRYLGVTLSFSRIRRILNRLSMKSEGGRGILALLESWAGEMVRGFPEYKAHHALIADSVERVQAVRAASQEFFRLLTASVAAAASENAEGAHEGKLRYYAESPVFITNGETVNDLRNALTALSGAMEDVGVVISSVSPGLLAQKEETLLDLEKSRDDLLAVIADLDFLVAATGRNVYWFEYGEEDSGFSLRIQSAPLDVAERLAAGLYDRMETVVMTSATLAVAGEFAYVRERLGLNLDSRERITEFIAPSPFDYQRQSAVVVPTFLPSPKDADFITRANEVILSLAAEVGRGMLVLFTSRGHLHRSFTELRDEFARRGITLLAQGFDGSRNMLLRRFREDVTSVLFGTDSFWEGVDVPGKALEIVVIVRLPFAVPTDPVIQAQMEEVERAGKNPFTGYSVPEAAIKLRQGAGRLIRHRSDRGAVVILDSRMVTARYGAIFKRSLPGKMLRADGTPALVEMLNRWFAEGGENRMPSADERAS
jgi:ATP-dependent DNA helicase DinG